MNMEETFLTTIKRTLMFLMASASIAMARPELEVYEGDDGNARIDYKGDTWARVYEYSPEELTRQAIERENAFARLILVALGLAALIWMGFIIAALCRRDWDEALSIFKGPFIVAACCLAIGVAFVITGAVLVGVVLGFGWLFATFPFLNPIYTIVALIALWISVAWVKEYISNQEVVTRSRRVTSRITGQQTELREIAYSWAQLDRWDAGASMEEAFPHLSDDERRFLRIGTKHELPGDFQAVSATPAPSATDEEEEEITPEEQEAELDALVKKYEKGAFQ